jgi:hypothetical protein
MKKGLSVAAVLVLVAVALYFFFNSRPQAPVIVAPSTQNSVASQNSNSPRAPLVSSTNTASSAPKTILSQHEGLAARAAQVVPESSQAAELRPETVLQNVRRAVHQYGEMFGGNPVGTNPEITSQLAGNNPKHINFINAQTGVRINADGELVDTWGTPYFFHQMSGSDTEIHSAGPDKIMWTTDDLVVK